MIKILLAGANGRMGSEIIKLLDQNKDFHLVQRLSRPNTLNPEDAEKKLALPQNNKLPIADVFIDFSVKEALKNHLNLCVEKKIPMVIGITGLDEKLIEDLQQASKKIPIVYSPNMSIGVNLMYKLLTLLAEKLTKDNVDVAIQEIHHKEKKDAPSGTALKMRETIVNAFHKNTTSAKKNSADISDDIPIAALRLAKVPGEHTAIFAMGDEQLELTHKAFNRSIFAKGALKAAKWIAEGKNPGLYSMQEVLN